MKRFILILTCKGYRKCLRKPYVNFTYKIYGQFNDAFTIDLRHKKRAPSL